MTIDINNLNKLNVNLNIEEKYFYNGKSVPRVTDILSRTINEDSLIIWANNIGKQRKDYKTTLLEAANIGTKAHDLIEQFIIHGIEDDSNFIPLLSFKLWWESINQNNKVQVLGMEEQLICPWFGGTYDILLDINGKVFLADFKTSNSITYKHFLQLAAYRYMLSNIKNINIDGCIILKLNKNYNVNFEEYVLDFSIPGHYSFISHCEHNFISLVYSYYNTIHTKNMYNELWRGTNAY